jgi:putative ABC transport system permease protein
VLVAGQIALCVSLLAAAGLLARSLWALTTAPAGFRADGLLTFNVHLPSPRWSTTEQALAFYDDFLSRLKALPGVEDAAVASELPNGKVGNNNSLFIRGEPWAPDQPVPFILTEIVSDDYFHTLGVPLVSGRAFTSADRLGVGPVMVINQAMVDRYWPRGGAVGAQVHIGPPNPTAPWITIVGVVGNVRNDPASLHAEPAMYLSNRQEISGGDFIVRTRRDPLAVAPAVRRTLASLDGSLPITNIATMTAVIGDRFAARRLPVVLMTGFGALALLLACVGVYSMFANMAAAREREFGVRIALGSTRGSIAALVLRQGGLWMALGLAVGAVGIIAAARLLRTQLFGVPQFDPLAIGATVLVLVICAGVALLGPVSRASRVDPITVLR